MESFGPVGLLLVLITCLISFQALRRDALFDRYAFTVDGVRVRREYSRLISSGFVHVDWWHLLINMYVLLSFSGSVEMVLGPWRLLILYFASLIGGNLLALYIHRNDTNYRAVGASGAISGLLFAAIVLFPSMSIGLLFLPIRIPAWLFGLLYSLYSIYGIKTRIGNVGHDAHLGGALTGLLTMCLLDTQVLLFNWPIVLLLSAPTIAFLFFLVRHPEWLYTPGFSLNRAEHESKDERYNGRRHQRELEIDHILDKINQHGMDSLTERERRLLNGD